jgi:hypothetical protein
MDMVNGFEWMNEFSERDRREMAFACLYEADYSHGTDGHNRLLIISKLVGIANELERRVKALEQGAGA